MWIWCSWKLLISWDLGRECRLIQSPPSPYCWISLHLFEREKIGEKALQGTEPGQSQLSGPDPDFTEERCLCFPMCSKSKAVRLVEQSWWQVSFTYAYRFCVWKTPRSSIFCHCWLKSAHSSWQQWHLFGPQLLRSCSHPDKKETTRICSSLGWQGYQRAAQLN